MYGTRDSGEFRNIAPVRQGEELDVTIEAVGAKGDGIAKKSGFVLFVPGVKEGQHVRIRVTKVLRKVGFAELVGEAQGQPEQQEATPEPAQAAPPEEPAADSESFGEEEQQG